MFVDYNSQNPKANMAMLGDVVFKKTVFQVLVSKDHKVKIKIIINCFIKNSQKKGMAKHC